MARAVGALERAICATRKAIGCDLRRQNRESRARIDWAKPARAVLRHIHGLSPFPGAWCEMPIEGEARVKLLRCEPAEGSGQCGELLDDHLTIACKAGAIRILELQRAGKAPMQAADFLRGTPLKPPARLS